MRASDGGEPRRRRWRTAVVLTTVTALAGCYSYVPATPRALAPGTEVRVQLSGSGGAQLAALLGPRAATVEGRVVSTEPSGGLTLRPSQVVSLDGQRTPWFGDAPLVVPAGALASVAERRFARRRTIVVSAAAVTAATAIAIAAVRRGGNNEGGPGSPPPPPPP